LILLIFMKNSRSGPTTLFPPSTTPAKTGGSTVSAWRWLMSALTGNIKRNVLGVLVLISVMPGMLYAEQNANQQIEQAIERYLKQQLTQEAAAQGWEGARFTYTSTTTSNVIAPCSQLPQVTSDSNSIMGRQQLTLNCTDTPPWTVKVNVEANVFVPAVFSQTVIERGDTITAAQLKMEDLVVGKTQRGFFNDIDKVAGQAAKRRLRADQLISPSLLAKPLLVRRGQQVKMIANQDGIAATTMGEALENGEQGAVIRVKNLRSEKIVEARVIEAGVVLTTFH
jgi:flagella basal body P-ring formation protein FlgA